MISYIIKPHRYTIYVKNRKDDFLNELPHSNMGSLFYESTTHTERIKKIYKYHRQEGLTTFSLNMYGETK